MLTTAGQKLRQATLNQIAGIVTPDTVFGWHRKLVAAKSDTRN